VSEVALEGAAAPPHANGELLFDAPWQGRIFGMAKALCDQGVFAWSDFQAELIDVIADWDARYAPGEKEYFYYDHFLAAFERLLTQRNLIDPEALRSLVEAYGARPHGHDH
jgi:nitrile hydratase accessory protein